MRSWRGAHVSMGRMVRKQVYIDDRQDELLKREALRQHITESELIRRAIEQVYDEEAAHSERMQRHARFERTADEIARLLAEAGGEPWKWNREELYKRGRDAKE
jgi:hypothetical protein